MAKFHETHWALDAREPQFLSTSIGQIGQEDDARWHDLMTANPTLEDINALWANPQVADTPLRQRLAAMITAPYGHRLPFAMTQEDVSLPAYMGPHETWATNGLRHRLHEQPDLAVDIAEGVAYWLEQIPPDAAYLKDEAGSARCYQRAIYELLPLVSTDRALSDRLFRHFSITQPEKRGYEITDDYSPALCMLLDSEVPFEYRRLCLERWFQDCQPADYSYGKKRLAITQLADMLGQWTAVATFDPTLHNRAVQFLEDNVPEGRPYLKGAHLSRTVEELNDASLAYEVGRRHVMADASSADDPYRFTVESKTDRGFAAWLHQQASARGDTELFRQSMEMVKPTRYSRTG